MSPASSPMSATPTSPTSSSTTPKPPGPRRDPPARGRRWVEVTDRAFADEVTAVAKGLLASGIDAGDRVAVMSKTRYEWTLADFALFHRRRGRRADLRDLERRAGRVDPVRLGREGRVRRDRRARRDSSSRSAVRLPTSRICGSSRRTRSAHSSRRSGRPGRRRHRSAARRSRSTTPHRSSTPRARPDGRRAASCCTAASSPRSPSWSTV